MSNDGKWNDKMVLLSSPRLRRRSGPEKVQVVHDFFNVIPFEAMAGCNRKAYRFSLKHFLFFWFLWIIFSPEQAWAIQSHPEPEGLYVHQLAHVVFIIAMAFLAYWLEANLFTQQKGWRCIQVSALFFILWNVVAILGHFVEEMVPRDLFVGDPDWSQRLAAGANIWAEIFYVVKLDHLVCVPAMVCLFIGIRSLYKDVLRQGNSPDE
jgi:hypothetical protein